MYHKNQVLVRMKGLFKQKKNHLIKPVKKSVSQSTNTHSLYICHYQRSWEKM